MANDKLLIGTKKLVAALLVTGTVVLVAGCAGESKTSGQARNEDPAKPASEPATKEYPVAIKEQLAGLSAETDAVRDATAVHKKSVRAALAEYDAAIEKDMRLIRDTEAGLDEAIENRVCSFLEDNLSIGYKGSGYVNKAAVENWKGVDTLDINNLDGYISETEGELESNGIPADRGDAAKVLANADSVLELASGEYKESERIYEELTDKEQLAETESERVDKMLNDAEMETSCWSEW